MNSSPKVSKEDFLAGVIFRIFGEFGALALSIFDFEQRIDDGI